MLIDVYSVAIMCGCIVLECIYMYISMSDTQNIEQAVSSKV